MAGQGFFPFTMGDPVFSQIGLFPVGRNELFFPPHGVFFFQLLINGSLEPWVSPAFSPSFRQGAPLSPLFVIYVAMNFSLLFCDDAFLY